MANETSSANPALPLHEVLESEFVALHGELPADYPSSTEPETRLKAFWAVVGFVVAFFLMRLYEASHIHDDIPKPEFKIRQSKRAALVLSTFAAMLSALVWLLVQKLG